MGEGADRPRRTDTTAGAARVETSAEVERLRDAPQNYSATWVDRDRAREAARVDIEQLRTGPAPTPELPAVARFRRSSRGMALQSVSTFVMIMSITCLVAGSVAALAGDFSVWFLVLSGLSAAGCGAGARLLKPHLTVEEQEARLVDKHVHQRVVLVQTGDDARAAAIARCAAAQVKAIRSHSLWSDSELDTHRARLDLTEEMKQIAIRAQHVAVARAELGSRDLPDVAEAAPLLAAHGLLDQSLDSLEARTAALTEYRMRLDLLQRQRALLRQLERAQGVDLSEAVLGTAGDAVSREHLANLSHELAQAAVLVQTTLQTLTALADRATLAELDRS